MELERSEGGANGQNGVDEGRGETGAQNAGEGWNFEDEVSKLRAYGEEGTAERAPE